MIKRSLHQEDIIIINICVFNSGALKYIRQKVAELNREISIKIIVGDVNTPLSKMDRFFRQKINK